MGWGALFREAISSILRNKTRTLLTTLGIVIGVAAVIMMVAIGSGAQGQIEARVRSLGTNMILVTPGSMSRLGVSQGAQTFATLTPEDAERIEKQSVLVSQVSPVVMTRTQAIGGGANWRTSVYGVNTSYSSIRNWNVASGTFFAESDVRGMRKVAVLGRTVADALFPDLDPIGEQVQLRDVPFKVIGVLESKGQTAEGADQDDIILAPYTTVQTRLASRWRFGQIIASTSSPSDLVPAQEEIRAILRESHRLGASDSDDFTIRDQTALATAAQETTKVMTILLSAIASISLLVGGIGIMNIMLVSVTERTREIGLRIALGARGRDVLTQFLVESIVICLMGGVLGVALGSAGTAILGSITNWTTRVTPETVALALGFAAAVGIFFGYWPARRAASLDPIEALRYE
jgi:putative ABC transport system permease protein